MRSAKQLVLICFVCIAFLVKAQNKLTGNVLPVNDSLNTPALLSFPELNMTFETANDGKFLLPSIPKGYLKLLVIRPGYKKYSAYIFINEGENSINITLEPELNHLDEIVVYGNQQTTNSQTASNIEVLNTRNMRQQGALSLSDGIAKLPGVSQLTTGAGISKPVIRGLFGNRIQTVLLGLRFDNQQWQDEHGLGLSDIGVDNIEIIKGPATLFYGSEAMGGVLNIINEKPAPIGKLQADVSSKYFSNTFGYTFDAGVKKSAKNLYWGIRLGNESHADYSDGNNKRILNSRFGGSVAKATIGFRLKNWLSENNYLFAQNNFGFLMDAYQLFDKADARQSRSFERPHHTVLVNIFSSQNTFLLKASKLKVNVGAHVNNRQEQEGASGISLDMLLNTYVMSAMWQKNLNVNTELSIGSQNQFQSNKNQGSRIIVPDADLGESSLFVYLKKKGKYLVGEGGLRYDLKTIQTFSTGNLNNGSAFNPGVNIVPVNRHYNTVNGSLGLSLYNIKHLLVKLNASSGYRGPNLAELSSNGLHEGSVRYELGNVNLKTEQNVCSDVYTEFYTSNFSVFANAYVNRFLNYIYLQPGTAEYIGFRIYNYIQKNATLQGFEGGLKIHPRAVNFLKLSASYAGISGQTDAHENLPFIPAQKLNNELKLTGNAGRLKQCFVALNYVYVFAQNKANQFETPTPAYHLVNTSMGTELINKKNKLILSLSVNNLSNETYYDHLSRFKYYGIYNIGRSFNACITYQFN